MKISEALEKRGVKTHYVGMDDYYNTILPEGADPSAGDDLPEEAESSANNSLPEGKESSG